MWRLHNDAFQDANKEQFIDKAYPRRIGSSITAVNGLLQCGDELKACMPSILGVDPKSNSSNWDKIVKNYWDSLSVEVYSNGLDLDLSFVYDVQDEDRKSYIKTLLTKYKLDTDDEALADFVEGIGKDGKPNIPDHEKYRYGTPINPEHWLLYRYCVGINGKGYKRVSNSMNTIEYSKDIDFYIYDDTVAQQARKKTFEVHRKAMAKYYEIISKRELVDELLLVFRDSGKYTDDLDKDMRLEQLATTRPEDFINYINDKTLTTKATIEKYILAGILRRLPGTSLIVDNDDPTIVIGNNMKDAVTFFSPDNVKTQSIVNEYSLKYKSKKSK